jgi:hypothetical protein
MTHPCDGHVCDHCYICDVVGICCGTLSAEHRTQLEAAANHPADERLRETVEQDRGTQPSIAELVRREVAPRSQAVLPARLPLALPASVPVSISDDSRKEPVYVIPPRTT